MEMGKGKRRERKRTKHTLLSQVQHAVLAGTAQRVIEQRDWECCSRKSKGSPLRSHLHLAVVHQRSGGGFRRSWLLPAVKHRSKKTCKGDWECMLASLPQFDFLTSPFLLNICRNWRRILAAEMIFRGG